MQELSELEIKQDLFKLGGECCPECVRLYEVCKRLTNGKLATEQDLSISDILRMKRQEGCMIYIDFKKVRI